MTDLKFTILEAIYNQEYRAVSFENLLALASPVELEHAIRELGVKKLVKATYDMSCIFLTSLGANAYEEAKEEREKESEHKKQQRFNNKIAVASVFISLVSFLSGIIVESQAHIGNWFISLFH